ncbi:Beta-glucosidase-like glycosyl hydrolase [uncultured Paludibacter sp.]|nr:Beta-glucosidase-like glycosyl hydrolase [uncultured Paludibacter sp.]
MKKTPLLLFLILMLSNMLISAQKKVPVLGKDKIEDVIAAMTLQEKVYLLVGLGDENWMHLKTDSNRVIVNGAAGRTYDIPRLGITASSLCDGPAGLRIDAHREGTEKTFYCTAFPTETALASSWNTDLVNMVGRNAGNEVLEYGADVLLAPAINIHRNPLCGRNFEYYSEDPLLAGKMAASMIKGVQSNNVGTSLKHFAANNIETNRNKINAVISQRALREIYLRGFEIAVKESQPWTVMSSYNRLNGYYTSESKGLITDILKNDWGFKGLVMTDWWGGADAVAQMNAGNELLMPGCEQRVELLSAIKNKLIDEKVIDQNLTRILKFILKTPRFKEYPYTNAPDLKSHAAVSRDAATECMVLLKNDNNTLPFKSIKKIALFGKSSYGFIAGGTGSGEVNYEHSVSINEAFQNAGFKLSKPLTQIYSQFIDTVLSKSKDKNKKFVVDFHPEYSLDKNEILNSVKSTDIAIVTIGRNAGEGNDRKVSDFSLSSSEIELIKNVSETYHSAGKKVIVVLNIGGVIATADWSNYADAILLAWQTGQEGANALVKILKGEVTPSAKLPMTFPVKYEDVPSAKTFPGEPAENPVNAFYKEGIYVGYRYYDTFNVPVAYEFGYGLSYTQFDYSDITIDSKTLKDSVSISFKIKNTGKFAGKDIAQIYVSAPQVEIPKPQKELRAFFKTKLLKPNESEKITIMLQARDFTSFWQSLSAWVVEKGMYEISVGASSKDIRLKTYIEAPENKIVEKTSNVLYPNIKFEELSH